MIPPTQDPTITAAVIGGVVGLILILTLIVLFGGCCIWYQFCRVKEPEETKPGVFDINEYKASNPSAIDIDNKDNTHL
jgi:cellobiose-specific phosphotransferase system component IIC